MLHPRNLIQTQPRAGFLCLSGKKRQTCVEDPLKSKDDDCLIETIVTKLYTISLSELNNEESEDSKMKTIFLAELK